MFLKGASQAKSFACRYLYYLQFLWHFCWPCHCKDIICYPLKLRKIDNNTIAEKLAYIANAFEISGMLSKKVIKLTTYQKTIIALARLLICDRDLYLVDDIFDNLTSAEIEKIAKILSKVIVQKATHLC